MYIDFKNNIKYIRTTSRGYKLFTRGNCPEPCLGQFFLEFTPICNQQPAVEISKKKIKWPLFHCREIADRKYW